MDEIEIRQLCRQARGGSSSAQTRLLDVHDRLIHHVALGFFRPGAFCDLEDLVQQGRMGLLRAVVKFDFDAQSDGKPIRFATYAHYWITHFIRREIENHGRTIAIPVHKIREQKAHPDSLVEPRAYSFDQRQEWLEDENGEALARFVDPRDTSDSWCKAWENRQEVEELFRDLAPRQREVLKHRYGLFGEPDTLTQNQTAALMQMPPSRVGALERSAMFQLRASLHFSQQIGFNGGGSRRKECNERTNAAPHEPSPTSR